MNVYISTYKHMFIHTSYTRQVSIPESNRAVPTKIMATHPAPQLPHRVLEGMAPEVRDKVVHRQPFLGTGEEARCEGIAYHQEEEQQ